MKKRFVVFAILLAFAAAALWMTGGYAQQSSLLTAKKVAKGPVLDGKVDALWKQAKAIKIPLSAGANFPPNGGTEVTFGFDSALNIATEAIDRLHTTAEAHHRVMVLELMGREGQLLFCVFLTIPFMVPVSIPGVSTVFGLVILLTGFGLMTRRKPWLPSRLMRRRFPSATLRLALEKGLIWVLRLEKISRPRLLGLTRGGNMLFINGFMLIAGGILLMMPFGFVPFSNTLPGLAVLLLAIGMLQRDGWCVVLGYLTNLLTTVYFAFLLLGGTVLLQKLWGLFC